MPISGKFYSDDGNLMFIFNVDGTGTKQQKDSEYSSSLNYAQSKHSIFISESSLDQVKVYQYTFDGKNLFLKSDSYVLDPDQMYQPDSNEEKVVTDGETKALNLFKSDEIYQPGSNLSYEKISGQFKETEGENLIYTFNSDGRGLISGDGETGVSINFAQNSNTLFISKGSLDNCKAYIYTLDGDNLTLKDSSGTSKLLKKI